MSQKYNGYSNYATWKANLEFFSEIDQDLMQEIWDRCSFSSEFAEALKDLFRSYCNYEDDHKSIVQGAIDYFINDVNFEELASMYSEELE
jgi:hypothetical protein